MAGQADRTISGHVFKREGKRGRVWYAKYRLPDGRQVQCRIGPHWSDRKQAPPTGSYTKASARAWLDDPRQGPPGRAAGDGPHRRDLRRRL